MIEEAIDTVLLNEQSFEPTLHGLPTDQGIFQSSSEKALFVEDGD